jgi:hypothetical protein
MYLIQRLEGDEGRERARLPIPLGAGCTAREVRGIDAVEIWGTSFTDSGMDHTEFRFWKDGAVKWTRRVAGY